MPKMRILEDCPQLDIAECAGQLDETGRLETDTGQRIGAVEASFGKTKNRRFFVCPGCEQRSQRLYRVNDIYGCRRCHRLYYKTQTMSCDERRLHRLKKYRRRLGLEENLLLPLAPKPKHTQWRTYTKLMIEERRAKGELKDLLLAGDER